MLMTQHFLTTFQPDAGAHTRVFTFANAGGSAALFRTWALPGVEVCAVDLPGQGKRVREKVETTLPPLTEPLARDLLPLLREKPFAFFGYSMGALVAFDLIHRLRRDHALEPLHFFVAARRAPHKPDPRPPLHTLPDAAFIREMQRRYNGIPEVVLNEPELLALFLPILRANLTLIETTVYDPRDDERLDCSITAFGGLQDPTTSADDLAAWGDLTRGRFTRHMLPGDHFFVPKQQSALLTAIGKALAS
jgi:medium-chain acyl-[acyl-carrier-protein] hydrolase